MSSGEKRPAALALPVARAIVTWLRDVGGAVDRIEIAGSLRRGADRVSDIEIVCVPRARTNLLGEPMGCLVAEAVLEGVRTERFRWRTETHPTPPKDWKEPRRVWSLVAVKSGMPVDLFAVRPPAEWGAILAIRTGPADFSRRLVTACQARGLRCTDGRLVRANGTTVPTPEERDFLRECGSPWVEPTERR